MAINHNILLAGGAGIIGSSLIKELNGWHHVISLDKLQTTPSPDLLQVDLLDMEQISHKLNNLPKLDVLIFLVALAHEKGKHAEMSTFHRINVQTLEFLMDSLEKLNNVPQKIIFSSTISVYGERWSINEYKESTIPIPVSPYAVTKLQAENFLKKHYSDRSWILRFAPVYSQDFNLNIERRTQFFGRCYRVGKGTQKMSLCNIQNIYKTISAILEGKIPSDTYNVSDSHPYSYNDLLNTLFKENRKIVIPRWVVNSAYKVGQVTKNIFLQENGIKLLTDNIYPSKKIMQFVQLTENIVEN